MIAEKTIKIRVFDKKSVKDKAFEVFETGCLHRLLTVEFTEFK